MGRRRWREYALYKGEEYLDSGYLNELSKKWGIDEDYLSWTACCNRFKTEEHKRGYIAIPLIDDEEEVSGIDD